MINFLLHKLPKLNFNWRLRTAWEWSYSH